MATISDSFMTFLIVDDEHASRRVLIEILRRIVPDATVVQAEDAVEALRLCATQQFDVAFLDIEMPGQSGTVLAEQLLALPDPPLIVFATASSDHAVKAFDLNAIDYIVKPFAEDRVSLALTRVNAARNNRVLKEEREQALRRYLAPKEAEQRRLWAESSNGARLLVNFSEIGWISARDKEVFIRTAKDELRVRLSLSELCDRLPASTFVRVHRSHVVNINLAREVIPWDSHSMTLIMGDQDRTEIPVGRKYVKALKAIAGW